LFQQILVFHVVLMFYHILSSLAGTSITWVMCFMVHHWSHISNPSHWSQ